MAFQRGPDIKPFSGASQEPLRLLQQVTPAELASAVPFVKITKVDFRTGKAATDVTPLMFDLVRPATFADFGSDNDTFLERSNVSLNSINIKSIMPNGDIMYREVAMNFIVHRPAAMFDRDAKIPWREILEEGNSFILEYGWKADPSACPNPLFNGQGHVEPNGTLILSTRTTLMYVYRWRVSLAPDGQVQVNVDAMENGDLALRDARFSDAFEAAFGNRMVFGKVIRENDQTNVARVRQMIDGLPKTTIRGRGDAVVMGDILDKIVAPLVDKTMRQFAGYDPGTPVEFFLGNFNNKAGKQSAQYGARKPTSIGDFMLPLSVLKEILSRDFAVGRAMTLRNFIGILINVLNADAAWEGGTGVYRPVIALKLGTVETKTGFKLAFSIFDRRSVGDTLDGLTRLPLEQQSPGRIRAALTEAGVPLIEFGRGDSVILEANFEMQPNPLLQSIQIEQASGARKDRVQQASMPDVESRKGQSLPKDIVPISILEGNVTMNGNFIFDPPSRVWVDFFGSRSISGVFNILEQMDTLEPGRFVTQLQMVSEGIDPLNTRKRLTDAEIQEAEVRKNPKVKQKR